MRRCGAAIREAAPAVCLTGTNEVANEHDVRYWHKADNSYVAEFVRYWTKADIVEPSKAMAD
jgi:hypothetical protein